MKKRTLSVILSLCLILTMFMGISVYAAGGASLDKTQYSVGEEVQATITGLSSEDLENDVWLAVSKSSERLENTTHELFAADLPTNNIWEFTAPSYLGDYEVRIMDQDFKLIASAKFSVVPTKAKVGDIKLSKSEAILNEPMNVIVVGLTNEQLEADAWLGISKSIEKLENTTHSEYIGHLPIGNKYEFNAPSQFGKYEVRVFSDGMENDYNKSLFGVAEFKVISSKAKPGDIVLSKATVQPEEKMSVTVNGLTKGEIELEAWLGIEKADEKLINTNHAAYINKLPKGNIYEFTAPSAPGTYEVRVFASGMIVEEEEYEMGLFGVAQFVVSGEPTGEIAAGYEGLATWAAPEVNKAVKENLVTDKLLEQFPKEITREEFCELAILLYEKMTGEKAQPVSTNPFTDTKNSEVLKAFKLGIVNGTNPEKTLFSPTNKVTRQEISAMMLRTLQAVMPKLVAKAEFKVKFHDENQVAAWALEAVKFMNSNDIIKGTTLSDGTAYFYPKGNTTREQAILMILRAFNEFYKI